MSASARISQHIRSNVVGYVALAMCLTMAPAFAASVTAPKNSVTSKSIKNGQVKATDLAANAVGAAQLADGSVDSAAIVDGTIAGADVNGSQLQLRVNGTCSAGEAIRAIGPDGTVSCEADDVGSSAPTGQAGGDLTGTYPNPSLATGAVNSLEILDNTILGTDIFNGTVATTDLADSSVTGAKVTDLSLGGDDIAENTVHANRIVDNTIGSNKLQDGTVLGVDVDESTLDSAVIQKRVTGTCAVGAPITAIAANGTVSCGPSVQAKTVRVGQVNSLQNLVTVAGWGTLKVLCPTSGSISLSFTSSSASATVHSSGVAFDNDSGVFGSASTSFRQLGRTTGPLQTETVLLTDSATSFGGYWTGELTVWRQEVGGGETLNGVLRFSLSGWHVVGSGCDIAVMLTST